MEFHTTHDKRPGEDVFGLMWLVAGVVLFWQSYQIAGFSALSSPGAFPLAASGVMVIAAVIVVIGNARRRRAAEGEPILPATVVIFTAMVVAYAAALGPIGFLPASLLFLVASMKLLYRGGWGAAIGIALASLAAIYVIFRLVFQVVLPEGIIPEREIMSAIGDLFGGGEAQ
jgi:putative tricarboxylic transport membrane protein